MGVHPRHSLEPRQEPRTDQMGRPFGRHLQVPEVRSCGSAVGEKEKYSSMTYEKLSRAMRYYYKREILERVDGRRLVYKFGKNARGWRENEN